MRAMRGMQGLTESAVRTAAYSVRYGGMRLVENAWLRA